MASGVDIEAALAWLVSVIVNSAPEVKPVDWRDYISSDPMICHGKAFITGTRVMVTVILDNLADA